MNLRAPYSSHCYIVLFARSTCFYILPGSLCIFFFPRRPIEIKTEYLKCLHFILQGLFILYEKTDHKRRRSSRFRRIFTVAFLLFLPLRGALNPAGPIYPNPAGQS